MLHLLLFLGEFLPKHLLYGCSTRCLQANFFFIVIYSSKKKRLNIASIDLKFLFC